jgi:hypothetical protein
MPHVNLGMVGLRFFVASRKRGEPGPHALPQRTGKKQGLTIKLATAQSSAPLTTKSNPYGVCKCTRNAPLGQSAFRLAARHP